MRTHEEKIALSKNTSPALEVKAAFDNEMRFSLRPVIFLKLLKIGELVSEPPKPDDYYIKKMRKKEKKAQYSGQVRIQSKVYWDVGSLILVEDRLYFFE